MTLAAGLINIVKRVYAYYYTYTLFLYTSTMYQKNGTLFSLLTPKENDKNIKVLLNRN